MNDLTWTNTRVKLGALQAWSDNPKLSTIAQAKRIIKSFDKFGQVMTVAIEPDNTVLDGHQRLSALLTIHGADYEIDARQCNRKFTIEERQELVITLQSAAVGSYDWGVLSSWDAGKLKEWGLDGEQLKDWNMNALNLKEMLNAEIETVDAEAQEPRKTLSERFGVPPFSVLNARGGVWQDRKRAWIALGIESELGRGEGVTWGDSQEITEKGLNYYRNSNRKANATPSGSLRDAMTLQDGHTVRGDGKGRRVANAVTGGSPEPLARGYENGRYVGTTDKANNGLLGFSEQARSHYAEGSAKVFGTEGSISEQTGTSIFDPVLCELAYRWFMPQDGGKVLDPFAGGSVRGITASILGKEYTGVDLSARQIKANEQQGRDLCKDKQPRWIVGDSVNIKELAGGEYDFIFSCPPYADLEVYSDDPRDLSRMVYSDFKSAYHEIIYACVQMLKDNRFACFVVGDVRDDKGFYRNFPAETIDAFQDAGMTLYNEAILVTAVGSLPIRVGRQFDGGRKLGKTHQNVLVFYKGNPKAIKDFGAVEFGEIEELEAVDE